MICFVLSKIAALEVVWVVFKGSVLILHSLSQQKFKNPLKNLKLGFLKYKIMVLRVVFGVDNKGHCATCTTQSCPQRVLSNLSGGFACLGCANPSPAARGKSVL